MSRRPGYLEMLAGEIVSRPLRNPSIATVFAALLFLGLSGWGQPVRADRFHYQTLLMGQRAIGLGGAFTGIADDPSAAFYNPAGLAQIPKDGISISLAVNAFDKRTLEDGLVTVVGTEDLVADGQPRVPVSATMMLKLGQKDALGIRSHAVAFSTFTRDREDFVYRASLVDQLPDDPMRRHAVEAELRAERSELWYGPSYAYRLNPKLSFGISAFLSVINAEADTETTVLEGDVAGAIGSTGEAAANPMLRQQQRSIDINMKRFIFRVGALYKPSSVISLGLMLQSPSLHIKGKGDIRDRITSIDGATNLGTFTEVKRKLGAEMLDPWEIRAGLGYHPLSWLTLSLDASAYGPTGSASNPQQSLEVHESESPDDVEPTLGNLFMQSWYRRPTGNVSMGAAVEAGKYFDISAGFFTDFSTAPRIKAESNAYTEPDVNHLGSTFACAFKKNRYNISVGFLALWGQGDGYAFHPDAAPTEPLLTRTNVTDRTFMLFLYGHTKAVETALDEGYKKLTKDRKNREADEAEKKAEKKAAKADAAAAAAARAEPEVPAEPEAPAEPAAPAAPEAPAQPAAPEPSPQPSPQP